MNSEILKPVVVLVAWTLAMLGWTLATRLPALRAAGVNLRKLIGTRAADADKALPREVQWKAHNYNHLMEQPTLFYAVCGVIALTGGGNGANAWIAWGYVAFRVAHSLWQATVNKVSVRLVLFLGASLMLVALTLHAGMAVFA